TGKPRQRRQESRTVRVLVPVNEFGRNGVVRITKGKDVTSYFLDRMEADYGEAFTLTKVVSGEGQQAEPPYHVNLDGEQSSCECPGSLRWGTECKHLGCCRIMPSPKASNPHPTPAGGSPTPAPSGDHHERHERPPLLGQRRAAGDPRRLRRGTPRQLR